MLATLIKDIFIWQHRIQKRTKSPFEKGFDEIFVSLIACLHSDKRENG